MTTRIANRYFWSIAFRGIRMIYLTFKRLFETRAVKGILDFSSEYAWSALKTLNTLI